MSDNVTLFDRYGPSIKPAKAVREDHQESTEQASEADKAAYKAFIIDKTHGLQPTLRILYQDALLDKDTTEENIPYPLARVRATSHQHVHIYVTDGTIITLEGRNLKPMMKPIGKCTLECIQRFHERKFHPPGADEPIITSITCHALQEDTAA